MTPKPCCYFSPISRNTPVLPVPANLHVQANLWNSELLVQAVLLMCRVTKFHTAALVATFRLFHEFIKRISKCSSKQKVKRCYGTLKVTFHHSVSNQYRLWKELKNLPGQCIQMRFITSAEKYFCLASGNVET